MRVPLFVAAVIRNHVEALSGEAVGNPRVAVAPRLPRVMHSPAFAVSLAADYSVRAMASIGLIPTPKRAMLSRCSERPV